MNHLPGSDSPAGDEFDGEIARRLREFRDLSPPAAAQRANRDAVARELSRLRVLPDERTLPWWRRRVAIPLPLVALAAVFVIAVSVWTSVASMRRVPEAVAGAPSRGTGARAASGITEEASLPTARPVLEYYEVDTYLCGVGTIRSESGYQFQEP